MKLSDKLRDSAHWQHGRHKELVYQAADELDSLAAEVEALTAARDDFRLSSDGYRRELDRLASALPKTADGVTIVPGMEVFCLNRKTGEVSPPMRVLSVVCEWMIHCSFFDPATGKHCYSTCHNPEHYYSTRQAAEEAADNEN